MALSQISHLLTYVIQIQGSRTPSQCLSRWLKSGAASVPAPRLAAEEDEEASASGDAEKDSAAYSKSPPPSRAPRKSKKGRASAAVSTAAKVGGAKGFTWTKKEDDALLEAVKIHGTGSWNAGTFSAPTTPFLVVYFSANAHPSSPISCNISLLPTDRCSMSEQVFPLR